MTSRNIKLCPIIILQIMCSITVEPNQSVSPVYAILDIETTGMERKKDRIIQIGVVRVDNNVVTPWMAYVNPCTPRGEQRGAFRVHKISPDVLQGKPTFAEVAPKLCKFLENVEYIAGYNCISDWSFLMAEFDKLQGNEENKALMKKIKWIDLLRLGIKSFPGLGNYRSQTLLDKFSIRTKKAQSFHYQSSFKTEDQQEPEEFTLFELGEINWEQAHHDAVCDSFSAHALLKKLLEKNGYADIADLVSNFPQCCIDTELFRILEVKWKERKTSNEELQPLAARAEKFYGTMPSLRGKTLEELSKEKIEAALFSGFERDERVCLIYRAAVLNKVADSQKRKADSPDESTNPKESKTE